MKLLDTQIISYKFKKSNDINIDNCIIPSVVAIEFLSMQTLLPHKARYYIPTIQKRFTEVIAPTSIDHPFNKRYTDRVIFDFGPLHEPFSMFSNFSISELINQKNFNLFNVAVNFLEKSLQKDLRRKIGFLIDNNLTCEPIIKEDIEKGYELLENFINLYNPKGNFRNTWNDVLILCKALNKGIPIITEDKLLNRFASQYYSGIITEYNGVLKIDFPNSEFLERKINRESKWYVNKGWQYKIRNTG